MAENISEKAIVVLLILVILVSIVGTWAVLDATTGLVNNPAKQETAGKAYKQPEPLPPQTSGKVGFTVIAKEEKNE